MQNLLNSLYGIGFCLLKDTVAVKIITSYHSQAFHVETFGW